MVKKIVKQKVVKVKTDTTKNKNDLIKKALCKKALGFSIDEITEEYSSEDNENLKLLKRKVVTKEIPPDIVAIKALLEMNDEKDDISSFTDEELENEKQKLLKLIKGEENDI